MFPTIFMIAFEARKISGLSCTNWISSHASRKITRTCFPVFQIRLLAYATLARIHFPKIFRESWKTKREKKTNLIEKAHRICFNIFLRISLRSASCYEVVPYRKENAPDTCYAGAVAYGNAVHHLASRRKLYILWFLERRSRFHALTAKSNFSRYNDGISNAIINNDTAINC